MSSPLGKSTSSIFPSGNIFLGSITIDNPEIRNQNFENASIMYPELHEHLTSSSIFPNAGTPLFKTLSTASTTAGDAPTCILPSEISKLGTLPVGLLAFIERWNTPIPLVGMTSPEILTDLLAKHPLATSAAEAFLWGICAHLRAKEKFEKKEKVLKANGVHWKNATKRGLIPLETMFQSNQTPGKLEMTVLAMKLKMDFKKVSSWFIKRRQAATREKEKMDQDRQKLKKNCDLLHAQFSVTSYPVFFKIANKMPLNLPYNEMQKIAMLMQQSFTVPDWIQLVFKLPKNKPIGLDMEVEEELKQFEMEDDVELAGRSQ